MSKLKTKIGVENSFLPKLNEDLRIIGRNIHVI